MVRGAGCQKCQFGLPNSASQTSCFVFRRLLTKWMERESTLKVLRSRLTKPRSVPKGFACKNKGPELITLFSASLHWDAPCPCSP